MRAPLKMSPATDAQRGCGSYVEINYQRGASSMIEVRQLSKRYGAKLAVDGLDFTVRAGVVTGFLGPTGRASRRRCA